MAQRIFVSLVICLAVWISLTDSTPPPGTSLAPTTPNVTTPAATTPAATTPVATTLAPTTTAADDECVSTAVFNMTMEKILEKLCWIEYLVEQLPGKGKGKGKGKSKGIGRK